jgi:hypothetical protein
MKLDLRNQQAAAEFFQAEKPDYVFWRSQKRGRTKVKKGQVYTLDR